MKLSSKTVNGLAAVFSAAALAGSVYMYTQMSAAKADLAAITAANDIAALHVRAHELGKKARAFCKPNLQFALDDYYNYTYQWVEDWGDSHTRQDISLKETFGMLDMLEAHNVTVVGKFVGAPVQFFDSPRYGKILTVDDASFVDDRIVYDFIMDLGEKNFSMPGRTMVLQYDSYSDERHYIAEAKIGETEGVRKIGKYSYPVQLETRFCK